MRELLTDREIELVVDEASRNVPGERSVAREVRQIALAPSLVRAGKRLGDAQGERGIGVEEKAIEMIVVDHDEKIGCGPGKPLLRGDIAFEKGLPRRLFGVAAVVGMGDGRGMRGPDTSDDAGH